MTALGTNQSTDVGANRFAEEWETWHRAHEDDLAGVHGFLAITNIHWLDSIPRRFPDAPGKWVTGPDGVSVTLDEGEALSFDGEPRSGRVDFGEIAERGSIFAYWGDNAVEVAKRGGYDLIRPRHPDNALRVNFSGTPTFPPELRWVVPGRFVPFFQPRPTSVGAVVEGLEHVYQAPGRIDFEIDGQPLSLTAFDGRTPGDLTVLFLDATSGVTTYEANRGLAVGTPAADGTVVVDFNRATNLPCAYTDLATCPLPPAENRLAVAVEAGEKIPWERQDPAVAQTPRPPLPQGGPRG